jgi:2-polyprenyl-3-methyl-5-hydroxy-6-metoxy-1,4-benzoquinol methylase
MFERPAPIDPRDDFIARVVRGKSFADVGGLWGTENEKVSVAHRAGGRSLAMIDITPAESDLWAQFEARRTQLGVPEVERISGDVQALAETNGISYDVVHCSGVLYHCPDPLRLLHSLRRLTREYLVLASSITARTIRNESGQLDVPASGALFIPALTAREKDVVRTHWRKVLGNNALGLMIDVNQWDVGDFAPWWWLPTADALTALCRAAGFEPKASSLTWNDNALVLLLAVRPARS